MNSAVKPRNYHFFEKFTYFLPDTGGIIILLLFLLLGGLFGNVITIVFALCGIDDMTILQFVAYPVMFVPAMIYSSVRSRNNSFVRSGRILDNKHFNPLGGALCAVLASVGTLALSFCSDVFTNLLPEMPDWLQKALEGAVTGDKIWMNFLMVSVFAPFFEEWLCRGMVLRGLLHNGSKPVWAIVISALFFAIIHLNPWQAIPAFLIGCLFGYVYYKTGSLKLTMLMHAVNNTFALVMSNIDSLEQYDSVKDLLPGMRYWIIFFACLLLLVLIYRAFARIPLERKEGNVDEVPSLFEMGD
ncbi:MAG: CPBP family intramembrane metalloprotease [Bacteroidales bacterium]|nr:CPBP family intramembrane metalloprotease [Bacteroidales bacterium]